MKLKFIKWITIFILVLAIIGVILVSVFISGERKMINATLDTTPRTVFVDKPIKKIGIIGDSWVAYNKLDKPLEKEFKSINFDAKVASSGFPGSKSKELLTHITSDNSALKIINDEDIDIIVIIAGVNDTAGHIGSDFYSHHMTEIVSYVNSKGKLPVILEVPEYGIDEPESFPSSVKHGLYKFLFDDNKTDVIRDYRTSLRKELQSTKLEYKLIPFDLFTNEFHENRNLYKDQFHLSDEGNEVLGSYIAKFIANELSN